VTCALLRRRRSSSTAHLHNRPITLERLPDGVLLGRRISGRSGRPPIIQIDPIINVLGADGHEGNTR